MTRFFDSHAWNMRHRDAAAAVLRAVGLGPDNGAASGYISAELADATVRAGGPGGAVPREGAGDDPDWLGGGTAPQAVRPAWQDLG